MKRFYVGDVAMLVSRVCAGPATTVGRASFGGGCTATRTCFVLV